MLRADLASSATSLSPSCPCTAPSHTRAGLVPPTDLLAAAAWRLTPRATQSRPCTAQSALPTSQTLTPTNAANVLIIAFPVPTLLPAALRLSEAAVQDSLSFSEGRADRHSKS